MIYHLTARLAEASEFLDAASQHVHQLLIELDAPWASDDAKALATQLQDDVSSARMILEEIRGA